jgi:transcriptional regulator with XRE-family HTH domain
VTTRVPCGCCGQLRSVVNGAYLRWRRERAQLDQRTLARQLGISGPYLSDLERNRREIPALILRAYQKLRSRR